MAKPFAKRTLKVMEHFRNNPTDPVLAVAAKFNMSMSQTYALRKRALAQKKTEEVNKALGKLPWQPPAVIPVPEAPTKERRKVTLNPSQVAIANKMGVPLKEFVKEGLAHGVLKYDEITMEPDETNVDSVLDERAKDYGKFIEGAEIMQMLKRLVHNYIEDRGTPLAFDQREAIDMIIHKLGRIINGNPDKVDHWVDIAGYATLVADRLQGDVR
jgi:hypothetical protein